VCGRFALIVDASVLADVFGVDPPREISPRYNIAPTQDIPAIRAARDRPRECAMVRWGLIPPWAKDQSIGARMINARGETVTDKPSFRAAVKARRCLIPASGFFEWVQVSDRKQPYYIRFEDQRLFAFAGLWERWTAGPDPIDSCTIITTSPNELVAPLHDRMPAILPAQDHQEWLGPGALTPERLAELLTPHSARGMEAFPVSAYVNRPVHDDPRCIEPIA
jgi:putative SOS response-associated peptidase YedK